MKQLFALIASGLMIGAAFAQIDPTSDLDERMRASLEAFAVSISSGDFKDRTDDEKRQFGTCAAIVLRNLPLGSKEEIANASVAEVPRLLGPLNTPEGEKEARDCADNYSATIAALANPELGAELDTAVERVAEAYLSRGRFDGATDDEKATIGECFKEAARKFRPHQQQQIAVLDRDALPDQFFRLVDQNAEVEAALNGCLN